MRTLLLILVVISVGCAGTPPDRGPSTYAPVAAVPQKPGDSSVVVAFADQPERIAQERLVTVRKMGYSVVNEHGETLYCRQDLKTGSHVQHEMVCLTWKDLETLREQTQQGLNNTLRQIPPSQGH